MMPQTGKVRTHARTILPATPQRTAERRLVAPTPMMDELTQWVVLTGIPKVEAISTTVAAEVIAAKPWTGLRAVILIPTVFITRHPPKRVPMEIAPAERAIIQKGMLSLIHI